MTITVTDFERITGISRHTVYSWFYRDAFPDGIEKAPAIGKSKMIVVKRSNQHYSKIEKRMQSV